VATPYNLTVDTGGLTTFGGSLGVDTADGGNGLLRQIATLGGGTVRFEVGDVRSVETQSYDSDAVLAANAVFASTTAGAGGNVNFQRRVDSDAVQTPRSLMVNTAGQSRFGAAMGGTAALQSVVTDEPGTVAMDGGAVRTTGGQRFNELSGLVLPQSTAFVSTGAGDILIAGPIGSAAGVASPYNLTVNTGGLTTFGGSLGVAGAGGNGLLRQIATLGGGTVRFGVGDVRSVETQSYNSDVVLAANAVFASATAGANGNISFQRRVDSDGAQTPRSMVVNTEGETHFGGDVGRTAALQSVETDSVGTVRFTGPLIRTLGHQIYRELEVVVGGETQLLSVNDGDIFMVGDFRGTGSAPSSLTLRTGGLVDLSSRNPIRIRDGANLNVYAGKLDWGRRLEATGNVLLDVIDPLVLDDMRVDGILEVRSNENITFDGPVNVGGMFRSVTGRGGLVGGVTQETGVLTLRGGAEFIANTMRNQIDILKTFTVNGAFRFLGADGGSWLPKDKLIAMTTNRFEVLRPIAGAAVDPVQPPLTLFGSPVVVNNEINLMGFSIAKVEEVAELNETTLARLAGLFKDTAEVRTSAKLVIVRGGIRVEDGGLLRIDTTGNQVGR
jgi:hypothetical protein